MRYRGFWTACLVLSILAISLGLRIWGSDFGLPAYTRYHPDEHALVERAAQVLWTGDWNLHRFNYPPFYAYLQTGAYGAYFLWGAAQGRWNQILPFVLPEYYQVGRLLTAALGTLTIFVLYLVGRQMYNRRTGLLASALLGGCYLHIIHSHYATFDVMVGLLALLTLLFSDLLRTQQKVQWYLLAGLFAGLAGATKYNGAVAAVMPAVAHILATPWGAWGWLNARSLAGVVGFLFGFFGGNPFALGNLPDFLNGLATVLYHYGTEQPGFEGTGNWRWYPRVFIASADAPMVVAGTVGLLGWLWQERKKGLLLVSFPIVYYLVVSRFVVRFERNVVPLLPFLALGGGWLLDVGTDWIVPRIRRFRGRSLLSRGVPVLGLLVLLIPSIVAATAYDRAISQMDLREVAGQWVNANVQPGSRIAIEHYSIPFDHSRYEVQDMLRISDHDLAWYQEEEYDVLIVSDGVWDLLLRQREYYAERVAVYEELVANSELLAEFVPQPPGIVVSGYPTVAIYHFAPVRIYRVLR